MAITCPNCGADFDVTLFQFGSGVRCDCGAWVELAEGHVLRQARQPLEGDVPGWRQEADQPEQD